MLIHRALEHRQAVTCHCICSARKSNAERAEGRAARGLWSALLNPALLVQKQLETTCKAARAHSNTTPFMCAEN